MTENRTNKKKYFKIYLVESRNRERPRKVKNSVLPDIKMIKLYCLKYCDTSVGKERSVETGPRT